jgi:hypothetical protein
MDSVAQTQASELPEGDTAVRPAVAPTRDVHVLSVGSASPRIAKAVADGLGLPVEAVVDAFYRAPARLVSRLDATAAARLAAFLRELGVDATDVDSGPPPARPALLDIAIDLDELARCDEIAAALAAFTGTSVDAARALLLDPPGVVMGRVSAATAAALERALPAGAAKVIAADPDASRYAMFAVALTRAQRTSLQGMLPAGSAYDADGNLTLFDLDRGEADALWRRLKASASVRIVNEAFLRFELQLDAAPVADAQAAATLHALAGVPVEDYATLVSLLPLAIESRLAYTEIAPRMAAYAAAGFATTARLTTFEPVALEVLAAPSGVLEAHGFTRVELPLRTPSMSEPLARVLRARLEAAGADVVVASS